MLLSIDERTIEIPDNLIDQALGESWVELLTMYEGLDITLRMGMKILTRKILQSLEEKYGKVVRPPKGEDPNLHLAGLLFSLVEGGLSHATIEVTTHSPEHSSASSVSFAIEDSRKSWRQMASSGENGERQDVLLEEAATATSEYLPTA